MHVHPLLVLLLYLRHSPALVFHPLRCLLLFVGAHAVVTPLRDARDSVVSGGLFLVQKSVSGPAEDLRPVSEVEAGVKFLPACQARAGCCAIFRTATRLARGSVVTPSIRPEVPDSHFASPGRGLGTRQSMGGRTVCVPARSGIWVLEGDSRGRMLPANLDRLGV